MKHSQKYFEHCVNEGGRGGGNEPMEHIKRRTKYRRRVKYENGDFIQIKWVDNGIEFL